MATNSKSAHCNITSPNLLYTFVAHISSLCILYSHSHSYMCINILYFDRIASYKEMQCNILTMWFVFFVEAAFFQTKTLFTLDIFIAVLTLFHSSAIQFSGVVVVAILIQTHPYPKRQNDTDLNIPNIRQKRNNSLHFFLFVRLYIVHLYTQYNQIGGIHDTQIHTCTINKISKKKKKIKRKKAHKKNIENTTNIFKRNWKPHSLNTKEIRNERRIAKDKEIH